MHACVFGINAPAWCLRCVLMHIIPVYSSHVSAVWSRAAVKSSGEGADRCVCGLPQPIKTTGLRTLEAAVGGPTLAIISPGGTICKMNTLVKKEHTHVCTRCNARTSRFARKAKYTRKRKCLSFHQRIMCCL